MAITQWAPFTELDSMERRMRRIFEEIGFAPVLAPAARKIRTPANLLIPVPLFDLKLLGADLRAATSGRTGDD